jgi:hypothetical protein
MIFSTISTSKKPWKKTLNPAHPAVIIDYANRTVTSTPDLTDAIDSTTDAAYDTLKEISAKIKKS